MKNKYNFTVAIPTYNSSSYLKECLYGFRGSNYLDEILIGDDFSDNEEIQQIKKIIQEANKYFSFDIKLIENSMNSGAFKNKYNLVESSKNEWVYQIDSDNVPFPKIDKVISNIIENHNSQIYIYYPSKLIQFWKYKKIAKLFSKIQKKYIVKFSKKLEIFDIDKTKKAINEFLNYDTTGEVEGSPEINSKYVLDKHIFWVLNCGNFIVNKNQFINTMKPGLMFSREILAMDAVAFSYLWLKDNGAIVLHPKLGHYHRKRLDSVSYIEKDSSKISRQYFTDQILSLKSKNTNK
tara:strand:- start:2396 stop:3274 length:879 start_codon:yes stop_codon:yes gene_type:complete